ncbi:unnamed protein product [Prorocentrum cordatum]|uniref:H(+)-exporting diphosphatase n=1 Tax=Prorocentrum cordatum TaxID=2364126 RepID=A0ABN9VEC2_9DINO|nr:unnamed protein product [Polarella glacialis]
MASVGLQCKTQCQGEFPADDGAMMCGRNPGVLAEAVMNMVIGVATGAINSGLLIASMAKDGVDTDSLVNTIQAFVNMGKPFAYQTCPLPGSALAVGLSPLPIPYAAEFTAPAVAAATVQKTWETAPPRAAPGLGHERSGDLTTGKPVDVEEEIQALVSKARSRLDSVKAMMEENQARLKSCGKGFKELKRQQHHAAREQQSAIGALQSGLQS